MLPFHISCRNGNEDILHILINKIDAVKLASLIMSESNYSTPLHSLCRHKTEKYSIIKNVLEKLKACESLVDSAHSLDNILKKEDSTRLTILHIAIENNHLNIVELLFRDYNLSRDLRDGQRGNLPIHVCAKNGSLDMFKLLQTYDAVSFKQNNNAENALHVAAFFNKSHFIAAFLKYEKYLMNKNYSVNEDGDINHMACACDCGMEKDYVPCSKVKDSKEYTPLMTSLATLNQACFKVFKVVCFKV